MKASPEEGTDPELPRRAVPRLYAESFAPWCERARWALDHHRVAYREIAQVPLMAELSLRLAARKLLAHATVPMLVEGRSVLTSSDAIARYADRLGGTRTLFPADAESELTQWMGLSERVMIAGRAMLLPRIAGSSAALGEQLPAAVPQGLRPLLRPVARLGVGHLMRKYGVRRGDAGRDESSSRADLERVRAALREGRRHLVGGAFSYADVTVACALQFVQPVDNRYIVLGPASRLAWTHERLAADYTDLLAWRDGIYAAHRHAHAT